VTDPLPPIPEASELRQADSGAQRLERVVQAERGRLARKRMRGKIRVLAVVAGISVGLAIVVGAGVWAGHRYLPALLAPPPPPPKPVSAPAPTQAAPEPVAKPKKPRPPHHKGSHPTPAADTPPEPAAPGDEPPPPANSR
jgi:hypothetical protein